MGCYITEARGLGATALLMMQESSGDLRDEIGSNHAVVSGTALTYQVAGPDVGIPYGATFASGSVGTITDHADIDLGNGPFTIVLWLNKSVAGVAYNVMEKVGAWLVRPQAFDLAYLIEDGSSGSVNIYYDVADTDTTNWHMWSWGRGVGVSGRATRDAVDSTANFDRTFIDSAGNLLIGSSQAFDIAGLAIFKRQLDIGALTRLYAARLVPCVSRAELALAQGVSQTHEGLV